VIKKKGEEYCVESESGKELSCYPTEEKAKERLKEIEAFKHMMEDATELSLNEEEEGAFQQ